MIYLDHAATTPVRPEVLDAMLPFFTEAYANPSSVHGAGSLAAESVRRAREMIADVLGCRPAEIIFTAGGTEADNLALFGVARASAGRGRHLITSAIEHDAVLHSAEQLEREGFEVTYLPVDAAGRVSPDDVAAALRPDTVLISIMLANNEIGTIQPVREIAGLARARGIPVHTDAVQAAGALDLHVDDLGVDLLSVSAHKIYGPKGAGILYVRRGTPIEPELFGGGQERGRRSGTENVPGIVGMAVALVLAERERDMESARLASLRDSLIRGVLERVPGAHVTGDPVARLPGHASFYLDGVTGESVLVNLDMSGIACSSGSACRAGSTDPSHVLTAIGLPAALAKNGLRMTLGRESSEGDIERVLDVLPGIVNGLRVGVA